MTRFARGLAAPSPPRRRVVLQTNLTRAPLWGARGASDLAHPLSLYKKPFHVERAGLRPVSVRHALILSQIQTEFVETGCPADRTVSFSQSELVRLAGYRSTGTYQRARVLALVDDLAMLLVRSALRLSRSRVDVLSWSVLDWVSVPVLATRGAREPVRIRISEVMASLVAANRVVWLDPSLFVTLVRENEDAAILWMFLEGESRLRPFRYPLLTDARRPLRDTPTVTDLLGITDRNHSRVRARIRAAVEVIVAHDGRYVGLELERATTGRDHVLAPPTGYKRVHPIGYRQEGPSGTGVPATGYNEVRGRARILAERHLHRHP